MESGAQACQKCNEITEKIKHIRENLISPSHTKLTETLVEIYEIIQGTQDVQNTPDFYSLENKILIVTSFKLRSNNLGRAQVKIGAVFGGSNPSNRIIKVDPVLTFDRVGAAILAATLGLKTAQEIGVLHPW